VGVGVGVAVAARTDARSVVRPGWWAVDAVAIAGTATAAATMPPSIRTARWAVTMGPTSMRLMLGWFLRTGDWGTMCCGHVAPPIRAAIVRGTVNGEWMMVRATGEVVVADATELCVCGHTHTAHEHLRRGTDCALCGCPRFRRSRRVGRSVLHRARRA
jgi:hypothetical protein